MDGHQTYWMTVNFHHPIEDIYTSKLVTIDNYADRCAFSLDHFVPWSFVMYDGLWNIIPTFTKSDGSDWLVISSELG